MALSPELFRALGALCEPPDPAHARLTEALGLPGGADAEAHTAVFVLQLVPYASVYLGPDGMLGGRAAERIAGFWRALRLRPPAEPDHLAALLGLYASLAEHEYAEAEPARRLMWRHARRTLLAEHLLTWVPPYAQAVAATAPGFHAAWARLLTGALAAEAQELAAPPSAAHLRDVPGPPRPGDETFVRALLAPARSGLILTRADLARGARETGLGPRAGERAFVLRSLIDQDPAAAFGWLAAEAAGWRKRHDSAPPGVPAGHWADRAESTRRALTDLHHAAMEMTHVS
ncbi:TorD/DmsD family molecular chaperone [Actinomadura formosensis]|uniref:TorD/DmsD family molecular chaperone n=1 Tax=Actinomadura formosensis TaxID=60706 RepID=UPI00082D2A9C|nr:molecular chaperone TorD family protein [Actinomadura formosensis]